MGAVNQISKDQTSKPTGTIPNPMSSIKTIQSTAKDYQLING
jgi:hypothetical protein